MINYSNQNFLKEVQQLTQMEGVDVVYDSVGQDTMFDSFKVSKKTWNCSFLWTIIRYV